MAIPQHQDVLAVRQQDLACQAEEHIRLLTEYGKHRVAECKEGRDITPELLRRMKMLVNQEYRVADMSKTILRVCGEICQACSESDEVSEDVLVPLFDELEEYVTDLAECNLQRQDNIDCIVSKEKENLEAFCKLRSDLQFEEKASVWARSLGGAALVGVGIAAACPVTLAVGTVVAVMVAAGHTGRATQWLDEDIKRINAPIQYLETLKKNMEDSLDAVKMHQSRLPHNGRSARVKRRVELLLEEMHTVRRTACHNFVTMAGSETLADGFGFTEQKRLILIKQDIRKDAQELAGLTTAEAP